MTDKRAFIVFTFRFFQFLFDLKFKRKLQN